MIEAGAQGMMIPVEDSFAAWRKDPEYVEAYNALEDEFAHARLSISFRVGAGEGE